MVFDILEVEGIGEYFEEQYEDGWVYKIDGKVFLVTHLDSEAMTKTIEVRCDANLSDLLQKKYESVMRSRYFGQGGVEVVLSGQMEKGEIYDLVRLSYNLTKALVAAQ